ncbi:M14 family zinc carboxypeptidase [Psychrobium sp. 1_MG-2023]|uniref:M14 family zinc carboxypeptidase n=1 Tax=Psychrobium sp. 1_MG-2023 TaxID=3062624 RepID=UPI000C3479AB|nr:M14 family zinc carboxypeptidase [Psychrobium sp. 1_MG-2023]MDP2560008.1 M14 family zinc carboxypeptidase [Psychrobium sp. 1_MG-2023]PKF56330.1 hypothetical protein CW748_10245 [Alteromonadales bacterium alter-6D02]
MFVRSFFLLLFSLPMLSQAATLDYYLPLPIEHYQSNIAKPSETLGFELGERHVRHDQLKQFFYKLSAQSDRVKLTTIGHTPQLREQFLVTISSPKNLANLDTILEKRQVRADQKATTDGPLVVWLGYSVHGDEISGANASMAAAYHFAANQSPEFETILENTIIVLEPSINPDGMDRFVNWVSTFYNNTPNADPNHIEHHQSWVSGRTNHYWFDLNRDWLLLAQDESKNRIKYFHHYQPNVLGDFHEMGANSTYFFQPGIATRTHPLTPKSNTKLTSDIAKYHAKALDEHNRLYFTQESFDDFYYGKGSTYPDVNGGIGILFEQASSRGIEQDTINGLLTFEFGIKNQVLTSISTVQGAWDNRNELKSYRKKFYQDALKLAKKQKFKGYIFQEKKDKYRLEHFLDKLAQHRISVYPLTQDYQVNDKKYNKETSYYIPLAQTQYRLVQALFDQGTSWQDNTFYDVSGWTMPLAMNIDFDQVKSTRGLKLASTTWSKQIPKQQVIAKNAYGYAFEWHHFLAPKLLNELLAHDIKARVATKPFSTEIAGELRNFATGTIVIPAALQKNDTQNVDWQQLMIDASHAANIELFSLNTGLTVQGVDLGSRSLKPLIEPKVMLVGGHGISQYEAGEVRFYLDQMLNIPVSVIDHVRLSRIDLSYYTHIILVNGDYSKLSKTSIKKIKHWVNTGGVIIGQKRGAQWLAKQQLLNAEFVSKKQLNKLFDTEGLNYEDKEALSARKRISGTIFESTIDNSHPLGYGYDDSYLPLFRNSTLMMEQPKQPFVTLAKYAKEPLLSGYTDSKLQQRVAKSAAIIAHNIGKGRVIASTDVLAFRGYWLGSAKVLANSLFFSKAFNASMKAPDKKNKVDKKSHNKDKSTP